MTSHLWMCFIYESLKLKDGEEPSGRLPAPLPRDVSQQVFESDERSDEILKHVQRAWMRRWDAEDGVRSSRKWSVPRGRGLSLQDVVRP